VTSIGNGGARYDPGPVHGRSEYHVVCVDDDAEFVKSLELFLPNRVREASGAGPSYRFLFFTDPEDALDALNEILAEQGVLTMVISDQQMPHMKGTEFLGRIRERCPECVRVLLTGHAGLESAISAINEQLLDKYLTKPVDNEHDFTVSIVHLLQRFWMQRTIDSQRRMIGELYRFSNKLNALLDLAATLEQVTRFARVAFGCEHASIWMMEGDEFVLRGDGENASSPRARLGGPDVERLWNVRTARVSSGEASDWSSALGKSDPAGAPFLRATLMTASEVLGVLVVGDRIGGRPFDERDEEILTYIADTASIAIYNRLQSGELARAYRDSSAQAQALAAANERLRMLDRLKDDFLTFVSHELRTPLTVLSAVELLDAGGRADQAEIVGMVRNGYERLNRFIQGALAYRNWIVGEPSRAQDVLDVADLLRAAQKQVPGLDAPGADVRATFPDEPCLVRGGAPDLTEVFRILLDNAVRFSSGQVHVRVACEACADEIRLSIQDRGVGFPPELCEEILKPFTIADSLHHRSGSALNLAKAVAIVIAYGGAIRAESEGEAQGAKFTVSLPRVHARDLLPRSAPPAGGES